MGYFSKLSAGTAGPLTLSAQETAVPPTARTSATEPAGAVPAPQESQPVVETPVAPITLDGSAADNTAARQVHEAAEAKRRAEWDARQEQKRAARQAELDKLAAMSDAEVIKESTQRVSDAAEKITRRNMKEMVAEHIQSLCQRDSTFARRTMLPDKSMVHCFWYINRMAKEFVEQEIKAESPNPASGIYGGDVPDDMVYQWAVDYFDSDDIPEDKKDEEKFVPRPYMGKSGGKTAKKSKAKKEPKPKPAPKPKGNPGVDGQISLLGEAV